MMRGVKRRVLLALSLLLCCSTCVYAQDSTASPLNTGGRILFAGRTAPYIIRHLPVSSFPDLPAAVQQVLNGRGCLVPQTYEARQPENAVRASLERPGSSDWAVLCSVQGTVSLLVFFSSAPAEPFTLASAQETERLQPGPTGTLGFNWAVDPASPVRVHEAQTGLDPRPPLLDHDALADTVIERRTVYHYYSKGAWTLVEMPAP